MWKNRWTSWWTKVLPPGPGATYDGGDRTDKALEPQRGIDAGVTAFEGTVALPRERRCYMFSGAGVPACARARDW